MDINEGNLLTKEQELYVDEIYDYYSNAIEQNKIQL